MNSVAELIKQLEDRAEERKGIDPVASQTILEAVELVKDLTKNKVENGKSLFNNVANGMNKKLRDAMRLHGVNPNDWEVFAWDMPFPDVRGWSEAFDIFVDWFVPEVLVSRKEKLLPE